LHVVYGDEGCLVGRMEETWTIQKFGGIALGGQQISVRREKDKRGEGNNPGGLISNGK